MINGLYKVVSVLLSLFICVLATAEIDNRQATVDSLVSVALNHAAHGRFDESDAIINGILEEYKVSKNGTKNLYSILQSNAFLAGDYQRSYIYLSMLLCRKELKKAQFLKTLSELPYETLIHPNEDVLIKYKVDSLFYEGEYKGCHIRIPATIGRREEMMVLDNGSAFFSMASETFAKEHGIHPVGTNINVEGVVATVPAWIGMADSLSIGSMLFRNVIFAVIPDEHLENPVRKIDAILGANIFRLAGEMKFDTGNREITFPLEQDQFDSNLTLSNDGHHYADVSIGNDTLKFQLDLGANSTDLGYKYYVKYKDSIVDNLHSETQRLGGIGGVSSQMVYRIDCLELNSCGGSFIRTNIGIITEPGSAADSGYGILGADYLLSFSHASLNLQKMYLKVEE